MSGQNSPEKRAPQHRLLVASMPKAGTYLLAEILKGLGYESTGLHLFDLAYTDYSQATLEEARHHSGPLHHEKPLEESIRLIRSGSFAVGHLACQESVTSLLDGFKRIYLYRELRACLVSWMRFFIKTKRQNVAEEDWFSLTGPREQMVGFLERHGQFALQNRYLPMLGWLKYPGTLSVRFEDLIQGGQQAAQQIELIAWYLGVDYGDSMKVVENSLAADTLTKTPHRSRVEDFWSDQAEDWFNRYGGLTVNRRLGYPETPSATFPLGSTMNEPAA